MQSLGWKDPPEGENGNPLQYSCLKNSMAKRRLADYSPWGRKKVDMSEHACTLMNNSQKSFINFGHHNAWGSCQNADSDLEDQEGGLRCCISSKLPGDDEVLTSRTTLWRAMNCSFLSGACQASRPTAHLEWIPSCAAFKHSVNTLTLMFNILAFLPHSLQGIWGQEILSHL